MQTIYAVVTNVCCNLYVEVQAEEIERENKTLSGYVCAVSVTPRKTFSESQSFGVIDDCKTN